MAYIKMNQAFETRTAELQILQARNTILTYKTSILHTDNLDTDILDEYARKTLAIAKPHELIIPQNNSNKKL